MPLAFHTSARRPVAFWILVRELFLLHSERPRELRWYHAAGMLFGDWGTSRLYVLGAAFLMSGHASFWYVTAMCALVSLVGFSYTIICAHFPDGGGVCWQKPHAVVFAGSILGLGLTARYFAQRPPKSAPAPAPADVRPITSDSGLRAAIPANSPRILVPTRGNPKLLDFAVNYARDKKAVIFVAFIRDVAISFRERNEKLGTEHMTLANDAEAQRIFAEVKKRAEAAGVPFVPLYAVHNSPPEVILDYAATLGVDAVLMGVSRRGALWKTLKGDVLKEVIEYLPQSIPLLVHA